jgi:type I restriction enzyme, S subunit
MDTKALRQKILDLAIHGHLLPQDPNDEPAIELLKRIRKEKEYLIKEGTIKKTKQSPTSDTPQYPYTLPKGWEWTTLGEICSKIVDGDHNPPKGEILKTQYLMLSAQNIANNSLCNLDTVRYLSKNTFDICNKRTQVTNGDLLITIVGTLGRTCIYDNSINITLQRSVACVSTYIYNYYLKYCIDSPYIQIYMERHAKGTAQRGFYLNQLEELLLPLPPLAEQERIVGEIERWFDLIDIIEKNKTNLKQTIKQTKNKILDLAIHGHLLPQDPNDEPAIELLKRIRKEKEHLIKEGIIKKTKQSPTSDTPQYPYTLPKGWEWCKLDDCCHIAGRIGFRGYTKDDLVDKQKGAITLSPSNIVNGVMDLSKCAYISWDKYEESPEIKVSSGNILLVKTGSSFGKCALVEDLPWKSTINPQFVVLKYISINAHYLISVLQSSYARKNYDNFVLGSAIPTFTQVALGNMPIPLPPLAEQERIVGEIEKIFAVLDRIEREV